MPDCQLAIVGNGPAAHRVIEQLREAGDTRSITLFGEEGPGYNRIRLSEWLAGGCDVEDLLTHSELDYQAANVTFIGERVSAFSSDQNSLTTQSGDVWHWQQLVIATGSKPRQLGLEGEHCANVSGFRTQADVEKWLALQPQPHKSAVVVGGGVLGIEAAEGLAKRGFSVTLVHRSNQLMSGQLDAQSSQWLTEHLENQGIQIKLNASPTRFLTHNSLATGLMLSTEETLNADSFIICAGTLPNTDLVSVSNMTHLLGEKGIACTAMMQTTEKDLFTVGECAEVEGVCVGLVMPALAQADVCAQRLMGLPSNGWKPEPAGIKIKVSGLDVYTRGRVVEGPEDQCIRLQDSEKRISRALIFEKRTLVGAVLFNALEGMAELDQLFNHPLPDSISLDDLMFDPDSVLQKSLA